MKRAVKDKQTALLGGVTYLEEEEAPEMDAAGDGDGGGAAALLKDALQGEGGAKDNDKSRRRSVEVMEDEDDDEALLRAAKGDKSKKASHPPRTCRWGGGDDSYGAQTPAPPAGRTLPRPRARVSPPFAGTRGLGRLSAEVTAPPSAAPTSSRCSPPRAVCGRRGASRVDDGYDARRLRRREQHRPLEEGGGRRGGRGQGRQGRQVGQDQGPSRGGQARAKMSRELVQIEKLMEERAKKRQRQMRLPEEGGGGGGGGRRRSADRCSEAAAQPRWRRGRASQAAHGMSHASVFVDRRVFVSDTLCPLRYRPYTAGA